MTPEDWGNLRQFAMVVGAAAGAGVTAWITRGRRDRNGEEVRSYTGEPDNSPRVITRREWHDVSDLGHKNNLALTKVGLDVARLDREVGAMRGHPLWDGFARLEEQVKAHVRNWERAGERADADRREIINRLDRLDRRLDRSKGEEE